MPRFALIFILSLGFCAGSGLSGCSSSQTSGKQPNATVSTTVSTPSTPSTTVTSPSPANSSSPTSNPAGSPNEKPTQTPTESASPQATSSPANAESAGLRPPLTLEKLKNAKYYFLAKGPIQLTNGTYEDKETKRVYTLSDVVAYGDIDRDGIKDAVSALNIKIPGTGNFSYLVAVVNDVGIAKNVSSEFMGQGVKVKALTINPDNLISAVMDQYQAGDPDCCPSLKITRTYKLKIDSTPAPKTTKEKS